MQSLAFLSRVFSAACTGRVSFATRRCAPHRGARAKSSPRPCSVGLPGSLGHVAAPTLEWRPRPEERRTKSERGRISPTSPGILSSRHGSRLRCVRAKGERHARQSSRRGVDAEERGDPLEAGLGMPLVRAHDPADAHRTNASSTREDLARETRLGSHGVVASVADRGRTREYEPMDGGHSGLVDC